ncbi:MAG TPA: outer membrane lipoprotein-sorting protein [Pseudobdellovibrionaceae bacterium]|jgi:hypothetical protein
MKTLLFATLFFLSFQTYAVKTPDAVELLKAADRARGGLSGGLSWKLQLVSKDGAKENSFEYDVKVKASNVLAKCIAPARSKDEVYLFLDRNLWIHRPGLRKPLSLSSRQRLSGQAANGDIATTNYARDYTPTLSGEEAVDGVKAWKLKLKAKSNDLTYDQIVYWISQDKLLGIQAEFLTLDGDVFKKAKFSYDNSVSYNGKTLPFVSKTIIVDAKNSELKSELIYSKPNASSLNDADFNVSNLTK